MLDSIPLDAPSLQILLWIIVSLFLISIVRIVLLSRDNRQMRRLQAQMEKQSAELFQETISIHHDAQSWREKTQRQFDAVRSDFSTRMQQSERSNEHAQKQLDAALESFFAAALARAVASTTAPVSAPPPPQPPPPSTLPALPTMETLHVQALETELDTTKAELATSQQQNATLQRSLLLARRRQPDNRRKNSPRGR
ncbi:MAG: hypothetical protein U1F71_17835 [Verrucomicrobiaceae bacterium]